LIKFLLQILHKQDITFFVLKAIIIIIIIIFYFYYYLNLARNMFKLSDLGGGFMYVF